MDTELKNRLDILEQKIDKANKNLKTIKNVFLWTFIVTMAAIVIPLIAMVFVIPNFISSIGGIDPGTRYEGYNDLMKTLGY